MNLIYLIGILGAILVFLFGCVTTLTVYPAFEFSVKFANLWNFFDAASILIVIGCTLFVVAASFPGSMLKLIPKHLGMVIKNKKNFNPMDYIEQLVDLAQTARKNGLLSLEEKASEQDDPFFKQAIMMVVDAYDQDKVRSILENDIEQMSSRHEDAAAMYDKASSIAPAFGMVGTLVGLINMLKSMDIEGGAGDLGGAMGTALITTLYGCIMAHVFFGPIATQLRNRDAEEVLCKMIIVEGVMGIQSGENPKFLREHLMTYMAQMQRGAEGEGAGEGKGKKKAAKKEK